MKRKKITLQHEDGFVDGVYLNAGLGSSIVIIINGHNGFYNYGMFPYLQESLANNSISSYSFNFSHGGITGDRDYFDDLDKYQKNCMRLEVEDVMCVLRHLHSGKFEKHDKVFLLAHSLGGVPAIFSAKKTQDENIFISGVALISTVKQLNFWPGEMIEEWKQNKVYYKKNNRTKQLLPQGEEFLNEVLHSNSKWNVENEIKKLTVPVLIVHGENDESVPAEHGRKQFEWIHANYKNSFLRIVTGATHTYNTKHPFQGATPQLEEMIAAVINFIRTTS